MVLGDVTPTMDDWQTAAIAWAKLALYVHRRIMGALSEEKYRGRHPWYKRGISINPAKMPIAGAALIGIGVAIAHMAFR